MGWSTEWRCSEFVWCTGPWNMILFHSILSPVGSIYTLQKGIVTKGYLNIVCNPFKNPTNFYHILPRFYVYFWESGHTTYTYAYKVEQSFFSLERQYKRISFFFERVAGYMLFRFCHLESTLFRNNLISLRALSL